MEVLFMAKTVMNYNELRDKVLACRIGKNIGGTMGGPFEGTRDMQDIPGYTSPFCNYILPVNPS